MMIELSEKIAIINDSPKQVTLPCKIDGKQITCTLLPGKNEISPEVWEAVKNQNKDRFDAHYGKFVREWKTIPATDIQDELTGGPLSLFARKNSFECLSLHDALEVVENTSNRQILEGLLNDEISLGRGRTQVVSALRAKIDASAETQKQLERDIREWKQAEARFKQEFPGQG